MKFDREAVNKLEVGAMIEFGPLFPGLSDEPVVGQVTKVGLTKKNRRSVEIAMHYHDTFLGSYSVREPEEGSKPIVLGGAK